MIEVYFMTHYLMQGLGKVQLGGNFEFSTGDEHILRGHRSIANGLSGGLVLGPLHVERGILLLRRSDSGLRVVGEMEGWEYLLASTTKAQFRAEVVSINQSERGGRNIPWTKYSIPPGCPIIDCQSYYGMMIEVDREPQFIVNGPATQR